LAECGDRAHHDSRIERFEHLIAEAHIADHARGEILDDDVDFRHKPFDEVDAFALAQVDAKALLSAVLLNEESTASVADVIERAGVVAMRRHLNLDDLSAHPSHQAGGRRAGDEVGKVENLVAVE
jgi:hypothetical protein